MKKNYLIIAAVVVIVLAAGIAVFFIKPAAEKIPADLISKDAAGKIVADLVAADENAAGLAAYLYPNPVKPKSKIYSWGTGETGVAKTLDKWSYVAWIDREPGNAFFAHPTEFIYIDAKTGAVERVSDQFWPVIDGQPFEGDAATQVAGYKLSLGGIDFKTKISNYVKDKLFEAASAAAGSCLRIDPKAANAPTGRYYAVVVSGFGKNSFVFLEGAQQMYDGLKDIGYDPANLTFLGQGPARVDPDWDRQGLAKIVPYADGPKVYTSPENLTSVLARLKEKMTAQDSLFVFILSHGYKGGLALGRRLENPGKASDDYALAGLPGSLSADSFSSALQKKLTACEVMVLIDACYSGSLEDDLRGDFDPIAVKRLASAHSTDAETHSFGADLREPPDSEIKAAYDLDYPGTVTTVKDENPADRGGEFSSGFIENLSKTIFSVIYGAGYDLDAAAANKMTWPFWWQLGEEGACSAPNAALMPPKTEPPLTNVNANTNTAPAKPQVPAKKKISVIPYDGSYITLDKVKAYTQDQCDCCAEQHWHARQGNTVKTMDGRIITDPFKKCGLGTIREHPITSIDAP